MYLKKIFPAICLLVVCTFLLSSCAKEYVSDNGKLQVVATTGMIGDAVRVIAGDKVDLTTMMGPGVDPHLYKSTKKDMDKIAGADLIFYNGLHLEAKMSEVLKKMSSVKKTIPVAEAVETSRILHPTDFAGAPDPHIWFDVSLWTSAVKKIGAELIKADSVHAAAYQTALTAYLDSLTSLHAEVTREMLSIPEAQRILVTAHDAFGYFGKAYQIKVLGLQGISTVTEAGLLDVTKMIDLLVSEKIKAVFVESSVPKKAIEAVVSGCNERGHKIIIGGELFSDAMGNAGTPEGTYIGMVRHNVTTIVKALK